MWGRRAGSRITRLPRLLGEGPMGKPVAHPQDLLYLCTKAKLYGVGGWAKINIGGIKRERLSEVQQRQIARTETSGKASGLMFLSLRKVSHGHLGEIIDYFWIKLKNSWLFSKKARNQQIKQKTRFS